MRIRSKHRVSKDDLKEDKFQVAIEKVAAAYYRDRRRFWIYGTVALVAVVGVILMLQRPRRVPDFTEPELRLTDAAVAYMQGDLPRAEQSFVELARLFPKDYAGIKAHYYLANVFYMSQPPRLEEARSEFATFLKKSKDDPILSPAAQMGLGNVEEQLGNAAEAAKAYEAVFRRWPESPLAYEAMMAAGRCYRSAGALDRAEAVYEHLLEADGEQAGGRSEDIKLQLAQVKALRNRF
ncbi:tetratricopeptide repeat protein [candidate division WOR-3 bacterium]|nr:tetratricopeptide repeat protein [candidate division WOR-3 bacterium]